MLRHRRLAAATTARWRRTLGTILTISAIAVYAGDIPKMESPLFPDRVPEQPLVEAAGYHGQSQVPQETRFLEKIAAVCLRCAQEAVALELGPTQTTEGSAAAERARHLVEQLAFRLMQRLAWVLRTHGRDLEEPPATGDERTEWLDRSSRFLGDKLAEQLLQDFFGDSA